MARWTRPQAQGSVALDRGAYKPLCAVLGTEPELRHAIGDRIYDAFAPNGLLTQHDA